MKQSTPEQPWPLGRTFATLVALVDPEKVGQRLCGCGPVLKQRMLLLWGKDSEEHICNETWLLEISPLGFSWKLVGYKTSTLVL